MRLIFLKSSLHVHVSPLVFPSFSSHSFTSLFFFLFSLLSSPPHPSHSVLSLLPSFPFLPLQGARTTKKDSGGSRARGHALLVPNRPNCVTILSLGKPTLGPRCFDLFAFTIIHGIGNGEDLAGSIYHVNDVRWTRGPNCQNNVQDHSFECSIAFLDSRL